MTSLADADEAGWDDEVDLICIDPDSAALAVAVAADADGRDVLVARCSGRPDAETLAGRLGLTDESAAYLDAVTADSGVLGGAAVGLTVRAAAERPWPELAGSVTFSGAALRDWAGECAASRYGVLCTTAAGPDAAEVVVDEFDTEGPPDIAGRLRERAGELLTGPAYTLVDLVLSGGQVVGAVLATPAGAVRVRAVDGIVIPTRPGDPLPDAPAGLRGGGTAELVLRSRPYSRFGRLELRV